MRPDEFEKEIQQSAERVFEVMVPRVNEAEMALLKKAYAYACEAHKGQLRKSGHPYIIHPVAVALIAAEELKLDVASVITAFLHDVVEDTPHTIAEIDAEFGPEVAFLVDIVTKRTKKAYVDSKQIDNFKQLLDSVHYDIRALMVKLADRLHNMRTLSSMRPEKQMKIAGETDYFYAPLANRLGLFDVKTEMENLAFKYRCRLEYDDIERDLELERVNDHPRLIKFIEQINRTLAERDIRGKAEYYYRRPYSLWRKMKADRLDFKHIPNKYYIRVTFDKPLDGLSEKDTCLKIYSLLTDRFNERPNSFLNQIDQAKENSYKCLRLQLLSGQGIWEDVQICSEQMVLASKLGPMAEISQHNNVAGWLKRFKMVLEDMANQSIEGDYMDSIVSSLYYDDIIVFAHDGTPSRLPVGATALDYAFECDNNTGLHAKYALINGTLKSIKTKLRAGDCIQIGLDKKINVKTDWIDHVLTYNAKRSISHMLKRIIDTTHTRRCPVCQPIPRGDIIGIKGADGVVTVHRRSCKIAIEHASQYGEDIVKANLEMDENKIYNVSLNILAVDRNHLLLDIIETITNCLQLPIESLTTVTEDDIVHCTVTFGVHSVDELMSAINLLTKIEGVDTVSGDNIR